MASSEPFDFNTLPIGRRRLSEGDKDVDIGSSFDPFASNMASPSNNNNMFPSFLDTSNNINAGAGVARQTASPSPQLPNNQFNGSNIGNANIMAPLPAGHQSDIEHVYALVLDLSAQLKQNREMTAGIVRDAEEIMV